MEKLLTSEDVRKFRIAGVNAQGEIRDYIYPEIPYLEGMDNLILGLDQSTSQTGMAILDKDLNILMIFDVINRGLQREHYVSMLIYYIIKLLETQHFSWVILEKPLPNDKSYIGKILNDLFKTIIKSISSNPSLNNVRIEREFPQSWRSSFIPRSKYTGYFNRDAVKEVVAEIILEDYPQFKNYMILISHPSLDSFEAVGVVKGFFKRNYLRSTRIITSAISMNYNIRINFNVMACKLENLETTIIKSLGEDTVKDCAEIVIFSDELSYEESIKRAGSYSNKYLITTISKKHKECKVMELNENHILAENEVFLVIIKRENK